jgi:hypothetical protein
MRYLATLFSAAVAAAVAYFTLALLLAPALITAEYWVREMIVVKREIARAYRGRQKILVAGGSGALFGVDACRLTEELGVPVLNLGLHAGLSLEQILGAARDAAERGDAVVLALEPPHYRGTELTDWQARNMIAWEPGRWDALPIPERIRGIALAGPAVLGELAEARLRARFLPGLIRQRRDALDDRAVLARFRSAPAPAAFAYSALNLDARGDLLKAEGSKYIGIPRWSPEDERPLAPGSRELLRGFVAEMARAGVVVTFANVPYVATTGIDREKVRSASRRFAAELAELAPMLDERDQMLFDRSLFFNTDLHLNVEGRRAWSERLIPALRERVLPRLAPPRGGAPAAD